MVRIVFTGGSGKAGRHVIPQLLSAGHQVLNLDLSPFPDPAADVYTLRCDSTDSGQVFNSMTSLFSMDEYGSTEDDHSERGNGGKLGSPGVVIHFAAYARDMIVPDNLTFSANTQATYNVIEAACKLGVRKIIVASSETTYGVCFTQGEKGNEYKEFPLLEEYDIDPMDTYGLTKQIGELTARSFARRFARAHPPTPTLTNPSASFTGVDIYAFRIGNVVEPHEYARDFPKYLTDIDCRKRNAWSYVDARELGRMCLAAIETSGLGFQVFNATNATASSLLPTETLLSLVAPNTPITTPFLEEDEAPLSNRKMRKVLNYEELEEYHWKTELSKAGVDLLKMEKDLREKLATDGRLMA